MVTNLPFLRWLVAHPALRAGRTTTAFLARVPAAVAAAGTRRAGRGAARSGSTCRRPPPHAPPDEDAAAHAHGPGAEQSAITAPMPGTVIRVLVAEGRPRRSRASRSSCSRR